MGLDEQLGRDSDSIKRWLAQRETYASEDVRLRVAPELRDAAAPEPIDDPPATEQHALEPQAPAPRTVERPPVVLHEPPGRPVRRRTPREREQLSDATYAARSTNLVFAPRSGIRQFLTLLVLVMAAATGVAGVVAYREQTETTIVAAVALGVLTLIAWGARAAAVPTVVSLKHGQLEVRRGGRLDTADLANARTPIAVVGQPQSRRWRVLIERPGERLLVLDPSMVDPQAFTEVLYEVHPKLWSEPGAVLEPWQLR